MSTHKNNIDQIDSHFISFPASAKVFSLHILLILRIEEYSSMHDK